MPWTRPAATWVSCSDVYSTAIEEGADEVSVVDTIGVCSPEAVERLIGEVSSWVGPDIPIHWHGHNDFGMATASAVAAVRGGARWIQGHHQRHGRARRGTRTSAKWPWPCNACTTCRWNWT